MSIKFVYLYRDAGNYKNWGEVIFSNSEMLNVESIENRIRMTLFDRFQFIAHQIYVPNLALSMKGYPTTDDHCFHELDCIEDTNEAPNDEQDRTIRLFIEQIEKIGPNGWKAYDPIFRH
jgi:hypothetical protein